MAGISAVALPNRPDDSEAGGSGAAAAGWTGPLQLEGVLACYITYVKAQKKICSRFPAVCLMIYHRYIAPLFYCVTSNIFYDVLYITLWLKLAIYHTGMTCYIICFAI